MAAVDAAQALLDAIRANAPDVVLELLETGADANLELPLSLFDNEQEEDEDGDATISKTLWLLALTRTCKATPIFMAIRNAYENYGIPENEYDTNAPRARNARSIIKHLIDHGADVQRAVLRLMVCNIHGLLWGSLPNFCKPIDLVLYLKKYLVGTDQGTFLDEVLAMLQTAARAAGHVKPPTAQVARSVVSTWKALCMSDTFSDVRFLCSEGEGESAGAKEVELHAHKAVLAAASEYFSTLFSGPWADSHADGVVKTANPPHIMRAILSFVYTGCLDEGLLDANAPTLVGIASEYRLLELGKLAEQSCIRAIALDNVKSLLQLAHLHSAAELKAACYTFVKRHAAAVLTNPDVMSLATEQPALWAELAKEISPATQSAATQSAGSKKRART